MTRRNPERQALLRDMAAALHRAELREGNHDGAPSFTKLPEWSQNAYMARADAALRVVQAHHSRMLQADGVSEEK